MSILVVLLEHGGGVGGTRFGRVMYKQLSDPFYFGNDLARVKSRLLWLAVQDFMLSTLYAVSVIFLIITTSRLNMNGAEVYIWCTH